MDVLRGAQELGSMQLSVKDVAKIFNVGEKTVHHWVEQDGLPAFRLNDRLFFNRVDVMEWATARNLNAPAHLSGVRETPAGALPDLYSALAEGGIFYKIPGADKESVMRSVVAALRLPDTVDRQFLLEVLLERESLGSTAVGNGIAIPHVRNPIVLNTNIPLVSLSFLENPIEFGAMDGKPVHALFTIISPTIRAHLHMLSCLAFVLQNGEIRSLLAGQAPPGAIMEKIGQLVPGIPPGQPAE